jgi:prepilin-type N-terminal cleavage/methylation domain-containing protein
MSNMDVLYKKRNTGYSLPEMLISVAILSAMLGVIAAFQSDIFSFNRVIQSGLGNQDEAKKIIRPFSGEVRGASMSSLGGYVIKEATESSFVFYSDIDSDGLKEEVRYYLEDGKFKKGVIKPSGNPLEYDADDEKIVNVVNHVINSQIFEFHDSTYSGTEDPLAFPVSLIDIRLVKISLEIDDDINQPPAATSISTQVFIRNLKDNHEE